MTGDGPSNLSQAVKRGVVWVLAERGAVQAVTLLGGIALARLLAPADFGVMALSFVVTGLASRLLHMGFGMALVQRERIRPDHVSTMFVMVLVMNGLLFLAVQSAAPYVGDYFDSPPTAEVLGLMAFTFVIRAFGVCPTALLRRRMDFRARATGSVIDAVTKSLVAVGLALSGFGVFSLVYGELSGAVVEKAYLVVASRWRPGLRVTRSAVQDLLGFGLGLSLKSTIIFLTERGDNVIVGKWLGTSALGLYEKAYNLMDVPVRELGARMNMVVFPAFARMQHERGRLRAAYRKVVLSLALLAYPVFAGLAIAAPALIPLVYGGQWVASVVPFQILCLAGPPRMLAHVTGSLLNATGAVGGEVKARAVSLVLLVLAVALGVRWGIVGAAVGVTVVNCVTLGMIFGVAHRTIGLRVADVLSPQLLPLAGTGLLVVVSLAAHRLAAAAPGAPEAAVAAAALAAGAAAYLAVIRLRGNEETRALLKELGSDVGRALGRVPGGGGVARGEAGGGRGAGRVA